MKSTWGWAGEPPKKRGYKGFSREEREAIYKDWKEWSRNTNALALAKKYGRQKRQIEKVIEEMRQLELEEQTQKIMDEGLPDMEQLKRQAWLNITKAIQSGDIATSLKLVGAEFKAKTKTDDSRKNAADVFGDG